MSDIVTIQDGDFSSETIYKIAQSTAGDKYLDELLGGIIADACTAWSNDETFLGVSPIEGIPTSVYAVLKDQKTASASITAFGHAYAIVSIMNVSDSITTGDASASEVMSNLTENLSQESVDVIKSIANDVIAEQLGEENAEVATVISSTVTNLLDGLLEVKNSGDADKLAAETEAITTVFEIASKDEITEEDIGDLVTAVDNSEVLQDSLQQLAEDGSNILNVELSESEEASVYQALSDNGITEDNAVYDIVTTLLGLGESD
jgi:hypothetical protein